MDWVNPWDVPSKTTSGTDWAVASFSNSTLTDNYIGLYDSKDNMAFAFQFNDMPYWGNIGALGNGQIDAVRFEYDFNGIGVNQTVTRQYQTLTFSQNSFPTFSSQTNCKDYLTINQRNSPFLHVTTATYIAENNIGFIVYDKNKLDYNMINCKFLQLIYSNDRYAIFKVLDNYNQTQT